MTSRYEDVAADVASWPQTDELLAREVETLTRRARRQRLPPVVQLTASIPGVLGEAVRTALEGGEASIEAGERQLAAVARELIGHALEAAVPEVPVLAPAERRALAGRVALADVPIGPGSFAHYMKETMTMSDESPRPRGRARRSTLDDAAHKVKPCEDERVTCTGGSSEYPLDDRCKILDSLGDLAICQPNDDRVLGPLADLSKLASILGVAYVLVDAAIGNLWSAVKAGTVSLCDPKTIEMLACDEDRWRDRPGRAEFEQIAAKIGLGSSAAAGGWQDGVLAHIRDQIGQFAFKSVCGEQHEKDCAAALVPALVTAYLQQFEASLSEYDQFVLQELGVRYNEATTILMQDAVVATYGDGCGQNVLSVVLNLTGSSSTRVPWLARQLDVVVKFHDVLDPPAGTSLAQALEAYVQALAMQSGGLGWTTVCCGPPMMLPSISTAGTAEPATASPFGGAATVWGGGALAAPGVYAGVARNSS